MSLFANLSLRARSYVIAVAILGSFALAAAISELSSAVDSRWFVLVALTLLTSSITVKVPSVAATISVSETFVFASVIVFGWPAGTVVASLDGLVISLWLQKRRHQPNYRVFFNATAPALSAYLGSLVYEALGAPTVAAPDFQITHILIPLCGFAATYFLANTALLALAIALEQGLSAFTVWRANFMWLWLNFFSGASMAALLVSFGVNDNTSTLGAIWVILPLLGISYFTYKSSMARIEDANAHLDQMNSLYLSTIETLAMAIDAKDQITHGHIRRVQTLAVSLAKEVGINDDKQIRAIEAAALLHDMGKLAVPEYILNKPGPLTPAEFERMKQHASVGADILSSIDFPYPVVPIVRHHHESWDGSGYPSGLRGAGIPIGARVLSVVDCFDALTSDRPYRPRLTDEEALQVIKERRGTMYDPLIVDGFMHLYKKLRQAKHADITEGLRADSISAPITSFPRLAAISASAGESRAMYRLIQRLAAQESYPAAIADVVEEVATLIPATAVGFYSPTSDGSELEVTHAAGNASAWLRGRRVRLGERIVGWSAATGRSVLNADAQAEFGELARSEESPVRSCLTVPVIVDLQRLGVLAAFSAAESGFGTEDQRIVEVVIRHIAPILARLNPHNLHPVAEPIGSSNLELTPGGMVACRCAVGSAAGTEPVGIALAVIRRHLGAKALTQIVHANDIFVGIGISEVEFIEDTAESLRRTLGNSGLLVNGTAVVTAATPRDGTSLEHLLYACRQRFARGANPLNRIH